MDTPALPGRRWSGRIRSPMVHNLAAMFVWQGLNYLAPLATLPYLARVLGPKELGVLGFTNAFIAYLILFTNWGFALSATQQVAQQRNDRVGLNEVFWHTILAKSLLGLLSLVLLAGAAFLVPGLRPYSAVLVIGWLQVAGNIVTAGLVPAGPRTHAAACRCRRGREASDRGLDIRLRPHVP